MSDKVIPALNDLIETSKDGEKGFALASKESKEPELVTLFSEGEQACRTAAGELQAQVRLLGGVPEDGGTMKASAHRGWISIRSAMTSRDSVAILEECERGEDYAKARYVETLKLELPEAVRSVVERQYQGVVANHDRMRDARNRYRGSNSPRALRSNV
ncbi:MAG: PA2169 family four-helix-bundle protein [Gammaproteobacteria bacterium]